MLDCVVRILIQTYLKLLPILPLLLSAGCAFEVRDSPAPVYSCDKEEQKATLEYEQAAEMQWQAKLAEQTHATKALQFQLLIKEAEFNQLKLSRDRAIQDVKRANARLRSIESKADAIADIAEAAVMINNARERSGNARQPAISHAEELLEESRQALRAGDVSDATYLAAKASELALSRVPISDSENIRQSSQAETVFATPLVMRVVRHSNIREQPTRKSNALFQLAKGTLVDAFGYNKLWIRVAAEDIGEGWIYYRLLEAADLTGQ